MTKRYSMHRFTRLPWAVALLAFSAACASVHRMDAEGTNVDSLADSDFGYIYPFTWEQEVIACFDRPCDPYLLVRVDKDVVSRHADAVAVVPGEHEFQFVNSNSNQSDDVVTLRFQVQANHFYAPHTTYWWDAADGVFLWITEHSLEWNLDGSPAAGDVGVDVAGVRPPL